MQRLAAMELPVIAKLPTTIPERAHKRMAAAFVLFAALTGGLVLEANAESCFRTAPGKDFSWLTSGIFLKDNAIFLADPLARKIYYLSPGGEELLPFGEDGDLVIEVPSEIRHLPNGGFVIEDEKLDRNAIDQLVRFNSNLEYVDDVQIKNRPLQSGSSISVLYDWTPWGDGFFAFADIRDGNHWSSSFLYFDQMGNDQVFFSLPTPSEVSYQHTKENHYLAVVDNTGYALILDSKPYLLAFDLSNDVAKEGPRGKGRRLLPLPNEFRHRPSFFSDPTWLAERGNPQNQLTAYLELMERSSSALEIHSWNNRLFLLAKESKAVASADRGATTAAQAGGPSDFWLVELNPSSGSKIAEVKLPVGSNAGHVTLVPGDEYWAVFATGPVQGVGEGNWNAPYLEQQSPLYLPADWFEDLETSELSPTKQGKGTHCTLVGQP